MFSFFPVALRSRSGRSIINGNWAIDRPGRYEGGGTMFTYKRPNEISSTAGESFLADGPTNEVLDVYVRYEYSTYTLSQWVTISSSPLEPKSLALSSHSTGCVIFQAISIEWSNTRHNLWNWIAFEINELYAVKYAGKGHLHLNPNEINRI